MKQTNKAMQGSEKSGNAKPSEAITGVEPVEPGEPGRRDAEVQAVKPEVKNKFELFNENHLLRKPD